MIDLDRVALALVEEAHAVGLSSRDQVAQLEVLREVCSRRELESALAEGLVTSSEVAGVFADLIFIEVFRFHGEAAGEAWMRDRHIALLRRLESSVQ